SRRGPRRLPRQARPRLVAVPLVLLKARPGPIVTARELSPEDLPEAIDRALQGHSILILPANREGAVTEAAPSSWAGTGTCPALILFTSGSTGQATAVALSARALTTSARATERSLSAPRHRHLCLPVNHQPVFQEDL